VRGIVCGMKATLDLPAALLRKLKAEAAAKGQAISKLVADKLTAKTKRKARFKKWSVVGRKLTIEQYRKHMDETRALMSGVPTVTDTPVAELLSQMRR
jgi:hypothetical protein